jgi:4-alpha-glucanotransferase
VVLKGDIPIGIFRHSVDAWIAPQLYNMSVSAGAPPDDFAVFGQNWGFPTYNWHEMQKDNYLWWRQRLQHMSRYFDAFRIDHILGFFRIWQIPTHAVDGLLGQFEPQWALNWQELQIGHDIAEHRLCEPFVNDHELYRLFGSEWARARKLFFGEQRADGTLVPLPHVATQVAVDDFVGKLVAEFQTQLANTSSAAERASVQAEIDWHQAARGHMFTLLRDVILLRAGHGAWVPRISMESTRSFECLQPEWAKDALRRVYVDFFYRRNEALWAKEARKKLPALCAATEMLVCGEDLGMVPHCVPQVMAESDILSLEVQRMPKDQKIKFGHPGAAPFMSVVTMSSHDTSTLRGWWHELSWEDRHAVWRLVGGQGDTPATLGTPQVALFLWQHMHSPAMWAVFPIQEFFAFAEWRVRPGSVDDERINVPANPAHYWRYRMHVALDELRKDAEFTERIKALHHYTGREH